jgi:orotate phosphoribosyltransferase
VIAGVATAGIPQGALVADNLQKPFVYVRSKPKSHGMKNMIEGKLDENKKIILIEDLISTGGSSIKAVEALRERNADILCVISIFSYGFNISLENFEKTKCKSESLFNYDDLISVALENKYINNADADSLREWRIDPEKWGEKFT